MAWIRRGVTINGLPIMLKDGPVGLQISSLDVYYEDCVIAGPGAFMIPVREASSFGSAIRDKLIPEIAGLPARSILVAAAACEPRLDCLIGEKSE